MSTATEHVKELRAQHNMTQQQVSDVLGIPQSNYSKYENEKLEFNHDMLIKLAKLFDITTDYLLGLED